MQGVVPAISVCTTVCGTKFSESCVPVPVPVSPVASLSAVGVGVAVAVVWLVVPCVCFLLVLVSRAVAAWCDPVCWWAVGSGW